MRNKAHNAPGKTLAGRPSLMTKPKTKAAGTRKRTTPTNLNRVPVTNTDPLQQCSEWLVKCTQTKAFQAFIPCNLSYVQVVANFHAKGQSGTYTPLEAKDGEALRCRGTIRVPSRATDAISADGVDVRLVRRLLEACVDMTGQGLGQSDKRKHKAGYLKPDAELERQAKASVKSGSDPLALVKLKKAHTERLNALALKVLAQVGSANPYGRPYVDLPDPATQTISCAIHCPNCQSERQYSERRLPLDGEAILKMAETLDFCGECSASGDHMHILNRKEYKGGAEALAKRATDKFNRMAAEMAGLDPELPEAGDTPKAVEAKIERLAEAELNKQMAELFNQ